MNFTVFTISLHKLYRVFLFAVKRGVVWCLILKKLCLAIRPSRRRPGISCLINAQYKTRVTCIACPGSWQGLHCPLLCGATLCLQAKLMLPGRRLSPLPYWLYMNLLQQDNLIVYKIYSIDISAWLYDYGKPFCTHTPFAGYISYNILNTYLG